MELQWKCCVKGTPMLMSSPKMVMLQEVIKSEGYTRNEAEAFQLHTSNVGWSMQGGQPNTERFL